MDFELVRPSNPIAEDIVFQERNKIGCSSDDAAQNSKCFDYGEELSEPRSFDSSDIGSV